MFCHIVFFCALIDCVPLHAGKLLRAREQEMAKYRHRIFEMFDLRDEAIHALTPKTAYHGTDPTASESWALKQLAVSRSASVTLVEFKGAEFGEETVSDLHEDFSQLADILVRDSKVLLDFAGVKSFCTAAIDELIRFKKILRTKGSRIVLCCLEPTARESFFGVRSP
jgi:anti-anti-sigma regulatory factor